MNQATTMLNNVFKSLMSLSRPIYDLLFAFVYAIHLSGLDPAGPEFEECEDYCKLDSSDSNFVDVIHTNGGVLGIMEQVISLMLLLLFLINPLRTEISVI